MFKAMHLYYLIKPLLPRRLQLFCRRHYARCQYHFHRDTWPINEKCGSSPKDWTGWPDNKRFALILTHDVDTHIGQSRCDQLADLEKSRGFRSSFNFVPEKYPVSTDIQRRLRENGFEIGVHGLSHDGRLFFSRATFAKRVPRINHYIQEWNAVGFRAPAMHHNLEWIHDLNVEYDASTFDTDPFEPQPDSAGTIFPFWVNGSAEHKKYVELPYTLPQDSTLFLILEKKGIEIWQRKLDWIVDHGGMALLNTHPDYMAFDGEKSGANVYPSAYYSDFLDFVKQRYGGLFWHALPKDMIKFMVKGKKESWETTC